jgi:hypothetical protein
MNTINDFNKYFSTPTSPKKYGLYCNSSERFMAVDNDLWTLHHAAKILSSKISSCVCVIANDEITNDNCYQWGLQDNRISKQDQQIPLVVPVGDAVEHKGAPDDIIASDLAKDLLFVNFIIKATYAMKVVDAIYNVADQKFFIKYFPKTELTAVDDDSGVANGFVRSVERILYLASNEENALKGLEELFNDPRSTRPTVLAEHKATFYYLLGIE